MDGYLRTLDAAFLAVLRAVRASYNDAIIDAVVEKFAWERVRRACTPEKVADPLWPIEGPVYIHYLVLTEILLCNEARSKLRKRKPKK